MATLALPSSREEAWRWADLPALDRARSIQRPATRIDRETMFVGLDGPRYTFIDGHLDPDWSEVGADPLATAEIASDHALGRFANGQGHELRVPSRGAVTIELLHVTAGGEAHLPLRIVGDEDCAINLVETFVGSGWANRLTQVELARSARLQRAVRVLSDDGFVSTRDEVSVGQGASYVATFLAAGGAGTRFDAAITLDGEEAFAEMGGALLTRAALRQECAVRVRHAAPNGNSHQTWRAVAADTSAASLAAAVEVARHAQKTDGEQSLRGLLLQRTATVNLKPELEIFADDVKCAHGATVGELDARALFYLETRGIPPARERALLTRAFVADALGRIGDETVRDAFVADADRWLEAAL